MDTIVTDYPVRPRYFEEMTSGPAPDGRDVCGALEDIIAVARDSEESFRQAAERASTARLQNDLMTYSRQRGSFVQELQQLEREYGREDVDGSGTVAGALHRAWTGIKAAITHPGDKALLEELARYEGSTADVYTEAIATANLPPEVSHCLSKQCAEVQKTQAELTSAWVMCES